MFKKLNDSRLIFIIIIIWYAVGNFVWWHINTPVFLSNLSGLYFQDVYKNEWLFNNAPLVTYISRFALYIFGLEYYDLAIITVKYIFFILSLFFIYKTSELVKSKTAGNISMVLFALTPAVYAMSRLYGHNTYELMTATTFNIYSLIKTQYFKDRKWTLIYAFSIGFGMMIKDLFIIHFCFPYMYIFLKGLKNRFDLSKVINILITLFIPSLIAGWHYFRKPIINKILYDPFTDPVPSWSFESLSPVTIGLSEKLLSPLIFILFLTGLIWFITKFKHKYKNIFLIYFFIPWTAIVLMPHFKCSEYLAGIIPIIILITSIWISSIKKKIISTIIIIFVIIIGIIQYIDFSYNNIKNGLKDISISFKGYRIMYFNVHTPDVFGIITEWGLVYKVVYYIIDNYKYNKVFIDTDQKRIQSIKLYTHSAGAEKVFFDTYQEKINLKEIEAIIVLGDRKIIETRERELANSLTQKTIHVDDNSNPVHFSSYKNAFWSQKEAHATDALNRKTYMERIINEQKKYDEIIAKQNEKDKILKKEMQPDFFSKKTKQEYEERVKYIHENFVEKKRFYIFGEPDENHFVRILERKK